MKSYKSFFIHLLLLLIVGCSKSRSIPDDHGAISAVENKKFFEELGAVKPYNIDSPFADAVSECIYNVNENNSCTLSKLPLLGISNDIITVKDILDRTAVSQEFLGIAFEQILQKMNPEIIQMFGSVNSVVISDNINLSFYYSSSGAIYLSGTFFRKYIDETETVTSVKDYRSAYGSSLQFGKYHDYIKNKKSISYTVDNKFRTYNEMFLPVVRLLFHELSHANDYFPRSLYIDTKALDLTKTYEKISYERYINSKLISDNQPSKLTSSKFLHLGKVIYHGVTPTEEDNLMLATDIADEFKKDVATDFYSYSSSREDFAMNAEESLMLYYFNAHRYMTIFKFPHSNFDIPEDYDYPIVWGQKRRVLVPAIKERALYAVENILGNKVRELADKKFRKYSAKDIPANSSLDDIYDL